MTTPEIAYTFTAKILLLSTDDGGRRRPIYSQYRPAFSFNTLQYFSGQITLLDREELIPGQMGLASVKLLPARHIRKTLRRGDTFKISEGKHVIGLGTIEQVDQMRSVEITH